MKKILTLFAVVGLFAFTGCEGPEGPPGEDAPLAPVIDVNNVNFALNGDGEVIDFGFTLFYLAM